jgi:hypothetical protein
VIPYIAFQQFNHYNQIREKMKKPLSGRDSMKKTAYRVCFVLIFVCMTVSLTGCSVLDVLRSSTDAEAPASEEQAAPEEEKDVADAPDGADNEDNAAPAPDSDEGEAKYFNCPQEGEQMTLGFDHTLTVNYEGSSITHILKSGMLPLVVQSVNEQGEAVIASAAPTTIPTEMHGVMDECSMEMEGTMVASATGTCIGGTVYLTITEDWQGLSGTMTCDDGQMPFMIPASGPRVHDGADGAGEVFHLVAGSQGFTSNRPFQEGEGYHSWTLYTTQVDLVPLVPDGN